MENLILRIFAAFLLAGIAMLVLWEIIPKPKEPVTPPSVDEIAKGVATELKRQTKEVGVKPNEQAALQQAPAPEKIPAGRQSRKPTPPIEQNKLPTPREPIKREPNKGKGQTIPDQGHAMQATLTVSTKQEISTRADAPIETTVVIQTTKEFPTLKLLLKCDHNITYSEPQTSGIATMFGYGVPRDHPNVFVLQYGSQNPPFSPANPLVIKLWSAEAMKCEAATI